MSAASTREATREGVNPPSATCCAGPLERPTLVNILPKTGNIGSFANPSLALFFGFQPRAPNMTGRREQQKRRGQEGLEIVWRVVTMEKWAELTSLGGNSFRGRARGERGLP